MYFLSVSSFHTRGKVNKGKRFTVAKWLGGNWFKKKTRSKKSRDTVPLSEVATEQKNVFCTYMYASTSKLNISKTEKAF